jgi:hypothetical protein
MIEFSGFCEERYRRSESVRENAIHWNQPLNVKEKDGMENLVK